VYVGAITKYFKDFGVLRETNRAFWGLQTINILDGTFEFAFGMIITIFLSQTIGFTDQEAGYAITVVGIISSITFLFIGPFVDYLGIRKAVFSGLCAMLLFRLGLIYCAFTPGIPYRGFVTLVMIFLSGVPASIIGTVYQIGNKRFTSKKSQAAGFNIWYIFMNIGALCAGLLVEVVTNIQKLPVEYVLLSAIVTTLFSIIVAFFTVTSNEQYEVRAIFVERIWKPLVSKFRLIPAFALMFCLDDTVFENDITRDVGKETHIIHREPFLVEAYVKFILRIEQMLLHMKTFFSARVSQILCLWCLAKKYGNQIIVLCVKKIARVLHSISAILAYARRVITIFIIVGTLIARFCLLILRPVFFLAKIIRELLWVIFNAFKEILGILLKAGKDILSVIWKKLFIAILLIFGRTIKLLGGLPNSREFMCMLGISICVAETKFEHHFRGGLAETRVIHPDTSYVDTLIRTIEILKKSWKYTREVATAPQFRRVLAALTLLVGVRAAFLYTHLMMPKYWLRVMWPDAHIGFLNNINPFIIVLGVLLLVPIINRYDTYKMLAWGALLASLTFLPLAIPWYFINSDIIVAYYIMSVTAMLFLSFGEVMWSPRLSHYIVSVAPSGQEGTYSAFASLPWFIGKTLAGGLSGVMLAKWCPEIIITKDTCYSLQGALIEGVILPSYWQTPEAMWLILGILAIVGPIIMLFLKDWFTVGMKQKV